MMINCKNCNTEYSGNFCPICGQSKKEYDKPFRFLFVDFLGNLFAFDTRFWRSLIALLFRPGKYASDYIDGQRARYMPPFRFYIFISFVFFWLLSSYLGKQVEMAPEKQNEIVTKLNESTETDSIAKKDSLSHISFALNNSKVSDEKVKETLLTIIKNPEPYMNSFLKFLSWSVFILMPVYAVFLWFIYRKSKHFYYNHLIFSINQHGFVFIVLSLILMAKLLLPAKGVHPENYLLWLLPIYLYIGNKQLYKRSWIGTFFRWAGSLMLYFFSLALVLIFVTLIWINSEFL